MSDKITQPKQQANHILTRKCPACIGNGILGCYCEYVALGGYTQLHVYMCAMCSGSGWVYRA